MSIIHIEHINWLKINNPFVLTIFVYILGRGGERRNNRFLNMDL